MHELYVISIHTVRLLLRILNILLIFPTFWLYSLFYTERNTYGKKKTVINAQDCRLFNNRIS